MKYSYNWLQKHIEEKLPEVESLKETIIFGAFEVESVEKIGDDTVMDIKVLPDRTHDCLSHYGMAREIAGLCKLTLKALELTALPTMDLKTPVEIKSDLCRRYIAIKMDGVKVGPSPEWLKTALETIGQKSINNIVDATNFVLFDRGQPVHAFDSANVDGGIIVRLAKEGEKIITLSGEEKELKPDMLVIADYIGPLAIAGVKGGKNAEVKSADSEASPEPDPRVLGSVQPDHSDTGSGSASTTSIVIEIGNFDPVSVRKTSRSLGLVTDASKRFENDLSTSVASDAAMQVVALIKDIAGGEVVGVYEHFPHKPEQTKISFTLADITRLLGPAITSTSIDEVFFTRYKYEYKKEGDTYTLTVPYERLDLTGPHDIAEELGRVIGYDTISPSALPFAPVVAHSPLYTAMRAAKAWLVHDGYREVQTYTFIKKGEVYVARGPKDKSALRTNLSEGLKAAYDMNKLNAPLVGLSDIKLFEIGTVFLADKEEIRVATVANGNVMETTLEVYIDEHKIVVENTTLETVPSTQMFKPWSVYPFVVRDIAVWVPDEAGEKKLADIVTSFATEYSLQAPVLFDRFAKDGKTSLAYRFVFQAMDKTLTEADVEKVFSKLVGQVTDAGFTIR
jgi:phenylalanyl-tRNA synthetase beta chain